MLISTYFKEDTNGARAEVHHTNEGYMIEYYDMSGNFMKSETHHGKSLQWAESTAENWALGIKKLNG